MTGPRIILWDVETTHNVVAAFQLRDNDYIPHQNILRERYIVCAAWKTFGTQRVHSVSTLDDPKRFKENPHDDRHVIQTLHRVLSDADVLVAHNGDQFDLKMVEGRILIHGMEPLPPKATVDTLKVARRRFRLNCNRLDYLGQILGLGRKKETKPGLWLDVLQGDPTAIKTMLRYNRQDVLLLEQVFLKLRPYVAHHVNREMFGDIGCPRCGSLKVQSRGVYRAITRTYQRFVCLACQGWFRQVKSEAVGTKHRVL